jgi:hypothetical protein
MYYQGIAQNDVGIANDMDRYNLTLDVFKDTLFVPYPDLINIFGMGVQPEEDEE